MADFYVKYAGEEQVLAHRVAEVLEVSGYFRSDVGYTLVVDADRLIGVPGWAHLDLDPTELGEDGEPGSAEGTAMAPYDYELFLDFRGPFDQLGRVLFDRLVTLDLPVAYCGSGWIFADFLPGRGVREFPAGTDVEEPGRSWWYESRLHADPAAPRSVSLEIRSDGAEVVALPHAPRRGEPAEVHSGPVVDELIRRSGADAEPTVLGELVLGPLTELRSSRPT